MKEISFKYRNKVEIELLGVIGKESTRFLLDQLPVHYIYPEKEEMEYPLFMLWFTGRIQWDIAIAPLQDSSFNYSKSDIKFLDYSAIGTPGIFSKVPAYQNTIVNQQDGLIVENDTERWIEAIQLLIEDSELRLNLAMNASKRLYSERVIKHNSEKWVKMITKIIEGK